MAGEAWRATQDLRRTKTRGVGSPAVFTLDSAGLVTSWSPGAERIHGYKSAEILGQHFARLCTPEDVAHGTPTRALAIAVAEGGFEEEGLQVRRDGSRFRALLTITPIRDRSPHPIGFVTVARDLTAPGERALALEEATRAHAFAEQARRDTEQLLQGALEQGGIGSWSRDLVNGTQSSTPALARILGYESLPPDWGFERFLELVFPCDRPLVEILVRQAMATRTDLDFECRIRHAGGALRWIWAKAALHCSDDRPQRQTAIFQDITERKRTGEALRQREQMLALVTGSARVGLVVVGEQYDYLFANQAYAEIFGLTTAIVGKRVPDVLTPAWPQIQPRLDRALAGERVTYELTLPPPAWGQTARFFDVSYEPQRGLDGRRNVVVVVVELTQRKDLELEHEKLSRLVELSQDFIGVADSEGRVTFLNACGRRLIGLGEADDVSRLHVTDYVPAEWHRFLQETVLASTRAQGRWEGEMQLRNLRTGALIDVHRSTFALRDASGTALGYATVTRDITQQKRAQEALRVSEERLRLMIEAVSDHAICTLDSSGHILTWSRGAEQITGYAAEEILGQHVSRLFTPEDIARGMPQRELELAGLEGRASVEGWRVRKNGSRFWANGTLAAQYDDAHRVKGFSKITRDLTAKRHNDELLRSVLNSTLDAVVSIDEQGAISMINRAGEQLFGYEASEMVGRSVNLLIPEPQRGEHDRHLEDYARTGYAKVIGIGREVEGARRDGTTLPLEIRVTEFRLDDQRYFVGILRDISAKRELEAQFRQAQKMEAFGQLAGGVAHDFNNLLTVISGHSDMLMEALPEHRPEREDLKIIQAAAAKAAALTHQLLAFSRHAVIDPRVLDLNAEVKNLHKMLHRTIGEDIALTMNLDEHLGAIRADAARSGRYC